MNKKSSNLNNNQKYIICPHCGQKFLLIREYEHTYHLQCNHCYNKITNPYCKKPILTTEQATGLLGAVIISLIIIISYKSCDTNTSVPPAPTETWINQIAETENDKGFSNAILFQLERKFGNSFCSVFETYRHKNIGNQEILDTEPLKSLIITTVGENAFLKMKTFKRSEYGVVQVGTEYYHYTYDCYKTTPNDNYFAMAFMDDGEEKCFYLELRIDGKTTNVSVDSLH